MSDEKELASSRRARVKKERNEKSPLLNVTYGPSFDMIRRRNSVIKNLKILGVLRRRPRVLFA